MNKGKIAWILIILLLLMGVGLIPLSIMGIEQKNISLYYESPTSTAPVVITFSGTVDEYDTAEWGWLADLRGVYRGYREISGSITLKIGENYQESKAAEITVSPWKNPRVTGIKGYKCTLSAEFTVPASKVVPYMIQAQDDPEKGTLPYLASYRIEEVGYSGTSEGSVYIQIVGDITDYLTEASTPDEALTEEPEDPGKDMDLQDNEVSEGSGGSKIYTYSRGLSIMGQISLPIAVLIVVVVIAIAYKKG